MTPTAAAVAATPAGRRAASTAVGSPRSAARVSDAVRGHLGAGAAVPARSAPRRRGRGDGRRRRVVRVGARRAPRRSWRCTGRRSSARQQGELWRELRDEWDAFWVVPMDDRCMARAVEIGATYGVRIVDAIHLAAADRLPGPVRYLTFERQQIPAADALGFEVVSAVASD